MSRIQIEELISRIKNVFNLSVFTLFKALLFLALVATVEYNIWTQLNYYVEPETIPGGAAVSFYINVASFCLLVWLLKKGYDKWALLLIAHALILIPINDITFKQGIKRYDELYQEHWKFEFEDKNYEVSRSRNLGGMSISTWKYAADSDSIIYHSFEEKDYDKEDGWNRDTSYIEETDYFSISEVVDTTKKYNNGKGIIWGKSTKIEDGWHLINDSTNIKLVNNTLYGFPSIFDTIHHLEKFSK